MLRKIFTASVFSFTICFTACGDDAVITDQPVSQYVISYYIDNDPNDPDWFKVIEIHRKVFQPVPAVKELGGLYYLPIMSRPPSFNNKVVEGEFYMDQPHGSPKPDTVFRVTKHLRDTLLVN